MVDGHQIAQLMACSQCAEHIKAQDIEKVCSHVFFILSDEFSMDFAAVGKPRKCISIYFEYIHI
jgi:hypothetical protein